MQGLMFANQLQQNRQQQMQREMQQQHRLQQQLAPLLQAQAKQALADRQAQEERRKAARANRFRREAAGRTTTASSESVTPPSQEQQAEAKLRLARKLLEADRTDAARASLQQLVSDYKSTEAAGAARKLLSSL